jgi:copper chaperone CopZ
MKKVITEILKVDGMTCHNCEKTVEKALGKLDGVVKVKASFHNRNVIVKYNPEKITKKDMLFYAYVNPNELEKEHKDIIDAICSKDTELSRKVAQNHIKSQQESIITAIKRSNLSR